MARKLENKREQRKRISEAADFTWASISSKWGEGRRGCGAGSDSCFPTVNSGIHGATHTYYVHDRGMAEGTALDQSRAAKPVAFAEADAEFTLE